jgi:PhnB protein
VEASILEGSSFVDCTSGEGAERLFIGLSDAVEVLMPLDDYSFRQALRRVADRLGACPGGSISPGGVRRSPVRKGDDMKIVTSLSFRGQCREAFEFYAKVLGGKITAAMPYGDAPPGMPITDEKYKSWLMHCWLEVGDQALMGADMDVGWARNIDKPKNGFDVTLHTKDKAEARRWFDQLSEGGKAVMPFGETFWSPGFGSLMDRFDVPWMVNTIPSQTGNRRKAQSAPKQRRQK